MPASNLQVVLVAFVEVQAIAALVLVELLGAEVIVTVGVGAGAVTVQVAVAEAEPVALDTRTTNVCVPTERPVYITDPMQMTADPESSRQLIAVALVEVKLIVALVDVVDPLGGGERVTVGAGTMAATTQETVLLTDPELLVALITTLCPPSERPA